jgi:branched-chain amino acid transport system substrate-binding protein
MHECSITLLNAAVPFHAAETKKGEIIVKKKLISGILATMFIMTMITVALPARVSAPPITPLKIGVVGPKGWIQWDGQWEGAQIARDMVNKAPGTEFGSGGAYYWPGSSGMLVYDGSDAGAVVQVQLVDIDEHSVPAPDPTSAVAELITKLEANPTMHILIGGFLDECVLPMEEAAMDYAATHHRPMWLDCGASGDAIIAKVQTNYERYKYMFRETPLNSSALGKELAPVIGQVVVPKLKALYGFTGYGGLVPTYLIMENLAWCDDLIASAFSPAGQAIMGIKVLGIRRPNPIATDFSADIAAAEGAGAKLVVHAFAVVGGASFIKQVGDLKPKFACVGINVESQMQEFYASVGGACEYETILSTVPTQEGFTDAESVNPSAKPLTSNRFWTIYKDRYGHCPIYTAWGTYEAILSLNETSYDPVGSGHASAGKGWTKEVALGDTTGWIKHMETLGISDGFGWKRDLLGGSYYRSNMLGEFKFSGVNGQYHDVFTSNFTLSPLSTDHCVRASVVQWQAGRMESIYPRDTIYARKWIVPPWMYSLETDFAGGTPADTKIPNPATPGSNFTYTTPDTKVGTEDMDAIAGVWFQSLTGIPGFSRLECDMQPYDHFVDVYDAARVGMDWGKSEIPK